MYSFGCSHLIRFIAFSRTFGLSFFRDSFVCPGRLGEPWSEGRLHLCQPVSWGRWLVPVKVDLDPCPRLGCRRWGSQSLAIGRAILIARTPWTTIPPRQAWRTQGPHTSALRVAECLPRIAGGYLPGAALQEVAYENMSID